MTFKQKILTGCMSICTLACVAGLVLTNLNKVSDIGIQNEFKVEIMLPKTQSLPEIDTVLYGNDLANLERADVEELIKGRAFLQNLTVNIKASVYDAYSLLPEAIKQKVPLDSVIMLNYSESPTMTYAINSNIGQIIASDTGENVHYYALQALGKKVAQMTGAADSVEFQLAYQEEHGSEWQVDYNTSEETAFGYIFASVFLGGYENKWNEIHTPKMYSYVTDVISNFPYYFEKNQYRIIAKYGYQDFMIENKSCASLDERVANTISKLPSSIQQIIKDEGLVFKYTDSFEGIYDTPEGMRALGLFSWDGTENAVPTITLLRDNRYFESTVMHEIAHFLDWYTGNAYREAFIPIIKSEFENAYWVKSQQSEYDETQKAEYFADAFSACMVGCDELSEYWKRYCPNTFAFMEDVLNDF